MPPPFVSASKAARALLSRSNGVRHWTRSAHQSSQFEKFAVVRSSSSIAGFKAPCVQKLINSENESISLFRNMHNYGQMRGFLGCGDGEEGSVLSKTYEEKRVIGYSPEQLYAVVAAVDMYEDFLPWCQRSKIVRHNQDGSFDAELEIGFKFFVESYMSHVELNKPKSIKTTASESNLFDHLINIWEFNPGPVPGSCDLYFLVDFKFNSPIYRQVASMFFKEVVSRLVGSFSDRCRLIYGPGVQVLENSYGQQRT
ncbi:hypothetical protein AQUCO_00900558v1 [Aquilegia coerulea]|uniref:Coenzyme Q-binding protein COQ10 START domain-containing protein n=1 Tax=Aquilegia coerulea TaxID=218851 RepID=A0A2G5EE89_AQUCA|nr:hypothetical protein AQUCO_00900558v1 [Aquilegia coerulea]PIA54064.1 hypothetical protein AQUCO_00900558v1 [Aquilegia coerulea]